MQQNTLAKLLNISPAMVSRLAKRGMPTDTLERAERWRRRHLEPGRIKGSRFDPKPQRTAPAVAKASPALPGVSVAEVESYGLELENALATGDQVWADVIIQEVRGALRQLTDEDQPRLSLRVWLALVQWTIDPASAVCHAPDKATLLNPVQFGMRWRPDDPTHPLQNHHVLSDACDWSDISINGWPQYPDDPEWVAMMAELA